MEIRARMRTVLCACLLILLPALASAQTPHPCDATVQASPVIAKPSVIVGFCHPQQDMNGTTDVLTSIEVQIDGAVVLTWTGPSLTPTSTTASSKGLWYFETPAITVGRGSHSVQASAVSVDGKSTLSTSFQFSTKGAAPQAVVGVRVR